MTISEEELHLELLRVAGLRVPHAFSRGTLKNLAAFIPLPALVRCSSEIWSTSPLATVCCKYSPYLRLLLPPNHHAHLRLRLCLRRHSLSILVSIAVRIFVLDICVHRCHWSHQQTSNRSGLIPHSLGVAEVWPVALIALFMSVFTFVTVIEHAYAFVSTSLQVCERCIDFELYRGSQCQDSTY